MRRMLTTTLATGLACGAALAEPARFSTPAGADEVLEAKDLPVALRYAGDQWSLTPRSSDFRLLARMAHKHGPVAGAFVYRAEPASADAVRERARKELADAFASHEVVSFGERVVNGAPVLFMKARAENANGKAIVIRNYYWTAEGVADYSLVTSRDVFDEHRQAIMDLLNGLEVGGGAPSQATTG